ncbi:MAG: hypothetical protein PHS42_04615 [Sulfurimonas sp.]|nr:hypothetical protein [Sulfurimonas sp.]
MKIIIITLAVLFVGSGALAYSNGNITLNLDDAKITIEKSFDCFVDFIKKNT